MGTQKTIYRKGRVNAYGRRTIVVNGKTIVDDEFKDTFDETDPRFADTFSGLEKELSGFLSDFDDDFFDKPKRPIPEKPVPQIPQQPKSQPEIPKEPKHTYSPKKPKRTYVKPKPKSKHTLNGIEDYVIRQTGLEKKIYDKYGGNFESVFDKVNLNPEYVPLYKLKKGYTLDEFNGTDTVAFYTSPDCIAVLRNDVEPSFEMTAVVHETIHHNLGNLRNKLKQNQKEREIEEGMTEFLTEVIMGEKDYGRVKSSSLKNKCALFDYEVSSNFFKQINEAKGLPETFEAYKTSTNLKDLMKYMVSIGIKQAKFYNKHLNK